MAARWRSSTPVSLARLFSPPPSLSNTCPFVCLFVCLLYRWQRGGEVLPQSAWRSCSLLLPPSAIHVHLFVCLFVCYIDGSEVEKFYPSQLGAAVLSSSLSPDEGLLVFAELQRARRCFVLENELHIIYQVCTTLCLYFLSFMMVDITH